MKQFSEVSKWIGVECLEIGGKWFVETGQYDRSYPEPNPYIEELCSGDGTLTVMESMANLGYDCRIELLNIGGSHQWACLVSKEGVKGQVTGRADTLSEAVLSAATAVAKEIQKNA